MGLWLKPLQGMSAWPQGPGAASSRGGGCVCPAVLSAGCPWGVAQSTVYLQNSPCSGQTRGSPGAESWFPLTAPWSQEPENVTEMRADTRLSRSASPILLLFSLESGLLDLRSPFLLSYLKQAP